MTDVSVQLLQSSLIIKKNTIIPHIEAAKKIIAGDGDLLKTIFLADEFDILTEGTVDFNNITEEYKILVGYDDIHLLQAFEMLLYLNRTENTRNSLNDFVKLNLKSGLSFLKKSDDEQLDILNTYWDYLEKLDHQEDRLLAFIVHIFLPRVRQYIDSTSFLLYSKKNITVQIEKAKALHDKYKSIIPEHDFFEKSVSGGLQRIIKPSSQ